MRYKLMLILLIFLFPLSQVMAAGDAGTAVKEKYRQVKGNLEQMFKAKEGVYAKDILEEARRTLVRAQEGIDSKNETAALQALEITSLRLQLAQTVTEERQSTEKTAVTRARADKLEKQLADLLSGKGGEQ